MYQQIKQPSSSQPTEVRPATAWNDPPIVQQKVKQPTVPKEIGIDQSKLFQPSNFISIPYGQPTIAPITRTQTPNSNGYIQWNPVIKNNNNKNFFNPINYRPNIQQNIGLNPIQNTRSSGTTTSNSPAPTKVSGPVNEKHPIPNESLNK